MGALSAYERVTVNDPSNAEAQAGLQRVRRKLQPDYSQVTVELGSTVESNPRYYVGPRRTEVEGLASASLRDERAINGLRWRTTGAVAGQVYSQSGDLDYGYAGLNTGPVIDLFSGVSMVPAVGGAATYYDHHLYYGEGAVSTTFEGASQGVYQSLQLKAAYRSYDDFFPSGDGFYTEARARFAFPNVLGNGSVVILSPWILYSDISGSTLSPALSELAPGKYLEGGSKLEAYKGITDWLIAGASIPSRRTTIATTPCRTEGKRADTLWIPAEFAVPAIFGLRRLILRLRLQISRTNRTMITTRKSSTDHVVIATLICHRFRSAVQPFWAQNQR